MKDSHTTKAWEVIFIAGILRLFCEKLRYQGGEDLKGCSLALALTFTLLTLTRFS
jgi:hypothetical protein